MTAVGTSESLASARESLAERALALAEEVTARSIEIDSRTEPPDDLIEKFVDAGFMAALTPRVYGGLELGFDALADIVRPISAACPSLGWVLAFHVGHNFLHCQFSEQCQQEIFADGPSVKGAGTLSPKTRLTPVDGGYRVSGRSPFCSGSAHADWVMFGGMVDGREAEGPVCFMVPRSDFRVLRGTWKVMGMRATGSYDVEVEDLFVPEHRALTIAQFGQGRTPGSAIHPNPVYSTPFTYGTFTYTGNIFLGALRGALNEYVGLTGGRTGSMDGQKFAAKPVAHRTAGCGEAKARLAESMFADFLKTITAPDFSPDAEQLQSISTLIATLVHYCRQAISELALAAGANAFRDDNRMQMFFRDITMASTHFLWDLDAQSESLGRLVLGDAAATD